MDKIFLDGAGKPFRATDKMGELWLCYYTKSKSWATLRKINKEEFDSYPDNLTKKEQDLYKNNW